MASFSGMDPEPDPELAELMALEAAEQRRSALGASNLQDDENDPELAELMRLLEQEQDGGA